MQRPAPQQIKTEFTNGRYTSRVRMKFESRDSESYRRLYDDATTFVVNDDIASDGGKTTVWMLDEDAGIVEVSRTADDLVASRELVTMDAVAQFSIYEEQLANPSYVFIIEFGLTDFQPREK